MSSFFVWANRGKESLTLDLKHPRAGEIVRQLLGQADVLIQNLAPGAARRMGLDFDALHADFPGLIVCDISGYGDQGPYRDKKAYDLLIQAAAGLISVTGTEAEPSRAASRLPISRPACTRTRASFPRCLRVRVLARASASRSPCSKH